MGFPMTVKRVIERNKIDPNSILADDIRRLEEDTIILYKSNRYDEFHAEAARDEGLNAAWERHYNGYLFTKQTAIRPTETLSAYRNRLMFEQGWHAALASSSEPVPSEDNS